MFILTTSSIFLSSWYRDRSGIDTALSSSNRDLLAYLHQAEVRVYQKGKTSLGHLTLCDDILLNSLAGAFRGEISADPD